ncbi:adenylate/guanylate cyclase domain-containing protein [Actinoplanes oblitus]|uniref:Adenylate/guanylate cyclase domain-containing protein n=1 Tax=Actinoplanes oblitus TaxID=3040509 RepID=A0ABY8WDW9_9ACTN|nr:adenylate/guanylate cyclase domain-containing protein [Actinoplanes oblitus]WIM96036.1 adenylate/guanylate cyclase domain-containing protein [Actinoplanes oblitus]
MFTDIEGSTRLARMLGDGYRAVLNAHRSLLRGALSDFGGVELLTEGDSFFVAFDNADAAVAACVEAQRRLAGYPWPRADAVPKVRMGLHTGRATPVGTEYASAEVHRAARVSAAAHGGQVLCSAATALAVTATYATAGHSRTAAAAAATLATVDLQALGAFRLRGFDDDEQLYQVVAPGLEREFPRPRTAEAPRHNLPAEHTTFVGRQAELAELAELLSGHRLVSVVGPGGAGKTRLSLAVAEQVLAAYPGGVWTIDAATASGGLPTALATALGLRPEPGRPMIETLVEQCAERRMLVILQTCDAAPGLTAALAHRLLARCRRLDVLTTGRAPLGLAGETVWRIPPMAPADAFALLSDRATAARGGRRGDDDEQLAELAARLEGSPLAIELAAARLRLMPADLLARRLDDPIGALDHDACGDGRHDSLRNNLDWSYRTLGSRAAELLRRLAVFAGPVDLATVDWCGEGALSALSELAEKSLIEVVPGPRYRMSGHVRSYALRQLTAAGDEAAVRARHLAWSLNVLETVAVDTDGQERTVSLTDLGPYVDEWQAALRWASADGDVRAGLRLAGALNPWWHEHGGTGEGRGLLSRLCERVGAETGPAELARAYLIQADLTDDRTERDDFLRRAERAARAAGDPALLVRALGSRRIRLDERGTEDAEQSCRSVIAQAERAGVAAESLPAVLALAELCWRRGALTEASELLGSARQMEAARPADRGRRAVDWMLGMVALCRGDLVAAHDHLVVALRSRLRHGFRGAAADAVAAIAVRCALGGDPATAAVLFGGAEAARGARRTESFGAFWSARQAEVRTALGDAAFDAAYADGAGLGFDRIVAMALAVEHPDLEGDAARFAQIVR